MKNLPTFYNEMIKNCANICLAPVPYHQLFFPSFHGLTRILKLTVRVFLFLALRVKISIWSVKVFIAMARPNHGIVFN